MNLYRIDVQIWGTAYIKAANQDDAVQMARAALIDREVALMADDELVSGEDFDSAALPAVSLSPVATIHGPDEDDKPELYDAEGS